MTTNEVIIFIVIIDELECKGYFNIIKQLTHVNNFKKILIKNKKKRLILPLVILIRYYILF